MGFQLFTRHIGVISEAISTLDDPIWAEYSASRKLKGGCCMQLQLPVAYILRNRKLVKPLGHGFLYLSHRRKSWAFTVRVPKERRSWDYSRSRPYPAYHIGGANVSTDYVDIVRYRDCPFLRRASPRANRVHSRIFFFQIPKGKKGKGKTIIILTRW